MMRRTCVIVLIVALSSGCVSCGNYALVDAAPDATVGNLERGDRVRVHLADGRRLSDMFMRVSGELMICQKREFPVDEIESIELWHRDMKWTWVFVGIVVCLAAIPSIAFAGGWY